MRSSAWPRHRDQRRPVVSPATTSRMPNDRFRAPLSAQCKRTRFHRVCKAQDCRVAVCAPSHLALLYRRNHMCRDKPLDPSIRTHRMPFTTLRRANSFISKMPWPVIESCTKCPSPSPRDNSCHSMPTPFTPSTYQRTRWAAAHRVLYATMFARNSQHHREEKSRYLCRALPNRNPVPLQ